MLIVTFYRKPGRFERGLIYLMVVLGGLALFCFAMAAISLLLEPFRGWIK